MTRLLPILLLLTGCANLSGTRDYVPAGPPVNPDDFTPLPRARVAPAPMMLSQPTTRTPHAVASILPPEPSALPMLLRTNAALSVQRVYDTPDYRYPAGFNRSNYWGWREWTADFKTWRREGWLPIDGAQPDGLVTMRMGAQNPYFTRMHWVHK